MNLPIHTVIMVVVLGTLQGFIHAAPIPRETTAEKAGSGGVTDESAKPLDSSSFEDESVTVILVNSCHGEAQKITFGHVRKQCVNVKKQNSPVLQIKSEPEDLSLTFYDQDECSGKPFVYNASHNSTPPFPPQSFHITRKK